MPAPFPRCSWRISAPQVVKVERPDTGDELRFWGNDKDGVGLMFKLVNRNKQSVTADLRTPLGVEIVKRLVADADIVVENYRKGTLERWGLGYDVLSEINPGLILVRLTGFGQTGPTSHRPGFGTLAEGYSGYAYITGYADRPPLLPGFGLADESSGLMGAFLAMVALQEKRRSGKGQVVDFAIYEPLFTLLGPQVVDFDQLGIVQERNGSRLPFTAPRNTYRTKDDKWVSISGSAQSTFERMCEALEVPELVHDPRFLDNRLRIQNAPALDEALQAAMLRFDRDELLALFDRFDAAAAPCNSIAEIFEDPHYKARENIVAVEDGELGGPIRMQNVGRQVLAHARRDPAMPGRSWGPATAPFWSSGWVSTRRNCAPPACRSTEPAAGRSDGRKDMLALPERVTVVEVGPRDGLQSLGRWIETDVKVAMIDRLTDAGFPVIEITSFASPRYVPMLTDAEEVVSRVKRRDGAVYRALVPNKRGALRAVETDIDEILGLMTVSGTYMAKNQNMTVDEAIRAGGDCFRVADEAGRAFIMALGMSLYCPYEGVIEPERTLDCVDRLRNLGVQRFYLAGSTGMEEPRQVNTLFRMGAGPLPGLRVRLPCPREARLGAGQCDGGARCGRDHGRGVDLRHRRRHRLPGRLRLCRQFADGGYRELPERHGRRLRRRHRRGGPGRQGRRGHDRNPARQPRRQHAGTGGVAGLVAGRKVYRRSQRCIRHHAPCSPPSSGPVDLTSFQAWNI